MLGLWIAAAGIGLSSMAAPTRPVGAPGPPPAEEGKPVEVGVGFHVVDFGRITARDESFDVTFQLELRWRDPRLAEKGGDGKIWTPRLNFDNAEEPPKPHGEPVIELAPGGWVVSRSVYTAKFSTPLDVQAFPFDGQDLYVRISLFDDASKIRFRPLPESMHMHDDAFITDWSVVGQSYKIKTRKYRPGGDVYSVMEYLVKVERESTFYVWRVLLPLTLLSLIPALVFWFEPTNLQPQISTCMGTLIAMLTFGYSVDFALPKVAYLTLVDRHAMIGFALATGATIAVGAVHRRVTRADVPGALRLQRWLRALYPIVYILAVGASFAVRPGS